MRVFRAWSIVFLLFAGPIARAADPAPYKDQPGPNTVTTIEADWKDAARNVTVPVKIYVPKAALAAAKAYPNALALIIFSHGLGGSRDGYALWGEHWASYGYVVIHPTHVGSDTSIILSGGGMTAMAAAINADTAARRVGDVKFIIDQMEKINAGAFDDKAFAAMKGKLDLKHIGMAGHSFGAETTLAIAGQSYALGKLKGSVDPRITAAIAMSPQGAMVGNQAVAFGSIKIPVLHITGTADDSPPGLGDVKAAARRIPFDNSPLPDTFLVIYKGAIHMTFAPTAGGTTLGARLRELRVVNAGGTNTPAEETNIHILVKESTTAFWDAYLKGDAKAKTWLTADFAKVMGAAGTFETKKK